VGERTLIRGAIKVGSVRMPQPKPKAKIKLGRMTISVYDWETLEKVLEKVLPASPKMRDNSIPENPPPPPEILAGEKTEAVVPEWVKGNPWLTQIAQLAKLDEQL